MRLNLSLAAVAFAGVLAACAGDNGTGTNCCSIGAPTLRVVNGFTSSVDVLVDGNVAIANLPAGTIGTAAPLAGSHTITFRNTTSATTTSQSLNTVSGAMNTIAVVKSSSGGVSTAVLDDTNSVVPSGATKVRVLHMAANAGVLQVYRTQPDYQTPISWQFPFTYQSNPTSLSAPFYQSTPGTWEIRIWQTPADASGWANAPVKVTIPLNSGEKKTVIILDNPAGGVRVELL